MNHCNPHYNTAVSAYEEMKELISIADRQKGGVVICPKPRQNGVVLANINPTKPFRLHMSHQAEVSDSRASAELLDIILKKGDLGTEQSPPFFCGSPPSRVPNPLVQDARFGDQGLSTLQIRSRSSTLARKGGYVRMKFGLKPAAVRVEGFDDGHRISAMA